ncbi:MAG: phosphotransferase [Actinomycetota bacterium]
MADFPTTTAEVEAEFLTAALHGSGALASEVSVAEVEADPAAAGVGFMGEVATVGVTYDGETDLPTSLVVKFPSNSPDVRAMMHPTRIYEREHRFYGELAGESPIATPSVFHITCEPAEEPAAEKYLLIMEDLGGLTLGDQVTGTSPDQAAVALRALGGHHARFWNGVGMEKADFIPEINGPLNQAGATIYEMSLPGFMEAFSASLMPELQGFIEGYAGQRGRIIDDLAAMPHTLVHFDFRADNLFFGGGDDVTVIDWQAISKGGGAADVGYFLSQNLTTEDRRSSETDLLHVYHDALVAAGVTGYDFDTLVKDYRVGIECGWIIPVMAVGSLDFTSERAVALWTAVIERTQNALLDHGLA